MQDDFLSLMGINTAYEPEKDLDHVACIRCNKVKHVSAYSRIYGGQLRITSCKACHKKSQKETHDLKKKHVYPDESFYKCPVCARGKSDLSNTTTTRKIFSLDHCHETGAFRGYICHSCNRALGLLKDNKIALYNAIAYLEKD